MKVKEVQFADGSGGLNDNAPPSTIAQNQFSKLENIITDDGGWPGKKRLGKTLMQYAPIDPSPFQGVDTITGLPDGVGPGSIRVECASTASLKVGSLVTFYDGVPNIVENAVAVTEIVNGTTYKVTNTVALAVGNTFKETGTLHLWHMDAPSGSESDDTIFETGSPYALQTLAERGGRAVSSVAGLFPSGGPLARLCQPAVNGTGFGAYGHFFSSNYTNLIDGLATIMFEGWIYINSSYTGEPVTIDGLGGTYTFSNSGAHILATVPQSGFGGPGNLGEARNGITIHRDWDTATNQNASDPYLTFTLATSGSGSQTFTSKYLPVNTWLFVRASYINGKVRLRVNGEIQAEGVASGTVDDDGGLGVPGTIYAGGARLAQFVPAFIGLENGFDGRLEELRIKTSVTEAEEADTPFKCPRGRPWPLSKANGTKQLVVGAGDGLYMATGDGGWTKMNGAGTDVLGDEVFDTVADWDAIQIGDELYLQNGVDQPRVWDGNNLWPWGNNEAPLTLNKVSATGLGVTGDVDYYVTFLYGTAPFKETGPGLVSTVSGMVATDEVDISDIPLGAPGCVGRRIYRVKKTGPDAGKKGLVRQISDNVTTSMTGAYTPGSPAGPTTDTGRDGLTDATLLTGAYTEMPAAVEFSKVQIGKYLLANHNRAWVSGIGDDPYALYWAELNTPHVMLVDSFTRATADSGPIVGLAKYYTEIHASKGGKSTLVLRGDNPSNWTQFEILHPTLGAVDHWSFVHRTTPQSDNYRLCFWAEDGAYAYAGQDFVKISEDISGTVDNLAIQNSNKFEQIVTTRTDFEAAAVGGGSIQSNMYAPKYQTDGLREAPGQARIVNQLDYLGLWKNTDPLVPGANIIAYHYTDTPEEMFFAADDANTLYFSPDNFQSKITVAGNPLGATERIIEIVKKAGLEQYFILTADPAGGGGNVYKFAHSGSGAGTWTSTYTGGGLYYETDVWVQYASGNAASIKPGGTGGRYLGINSVAWGPYAANSSGLNQAAKGFWGFGYTPFAPAGTAAYINHDQDMELDPNSATFNALDVWQTNGFVTVGRPPNYKDPHLVGSGITSLGPVGAGSPVPGSPWMAATAGNFYSFEDNNHYVRLGSGGQFNWWTSQSNGFRIHWTHRETPLYLGGKGTFAPQAFWEPAASGGGALIFVAADAEDSHKRVGTKLYKLTDGAPGTLSTLYNAADGTVTPAQGPGGLIYFIFTAESAGNAGATFQLATYDTVTDTLTTAGFQVGTGFVPLRMAYNAANTTGEELLLTAKWWYGTIHDTYTIKGSVWAINTTTGAWRLVKEFTPAGEPAVTTPLHVVANPADGEWWVMNQDKQSADPFIGQVDKDATGWTDYKVNGHEGATGSMSKMLFVPRSGSAGNYNWADRVYFMSTGVTEPGAVDRLVQLGLPSDWEVRSDYVSEAFNLGNISAFGNFNADFQGTVNWYFRNATTAPGLPASEQPVEANQVLNGFTNPQPFYQFRGQLVWDGSSETVSPYIDYVEIELWSGDVNVPRVVGYHWKGRTYWAVATVGQTENDLVLVYQKNNTWTTYTEWSLKGMNEFLGTYVALERYQLIRLENSRKDLGNLIRSRARTGYIMHDRSDKCIRDINFNIKAFVNNLFPNNAGWMKVSPYAGDTKLPADWVFPLTARPTPEPLQVKANFTTASFPYEYARALALEVYTSDDTGAYAPVVDQVEDMSTMILRLFVSSPRYKITRD